MEQIAAAFKDGAGTVSSAAYALGISPARLASEMWRHQIRADLPKATLERIGLERLERARMLLRQGVPKKTISSELGLGEWTIEMIELDRPALREQHRIATIERHREHHRQSILSFLQIEPNAGRTRVFLERVSAIDWLRRYDRVWLEAILPQVRKRPESARSNKRVDWPKRDAEVSATVRSLATEILRRTDRPVRITQCLLLKKAGALAAMGSPVRDLLPKTRKAAESLAEGRDAFLKRKIRWALLQYAKKHLPISMNRFRRVATLSHKDLLLHGDFIRELAGELGLAFDVRCCLAECQAVCAATTSRPLGAALLN